MRFKKIVGSLVSAALCLSVLSTNAMALGTSSDLTPVSMQIGGNITVSSLNETAAVSTIPYLDETTVVSYDIGDFSDIGDSTGIVNFEIPSYGSDDERNQDEYDINTYDRAFPLSSLTIEAVAMGKEYYDPFFEAPWYVTEECNISNNGTYATCTIDTTDVKYVLVRLREWGYKTSGYMKLDGKSYVYSRTVYGLNALGQRANVGDTVYGFVNDYIFAIPENTGAYPTSTISFIGYCDLVIPNITREATVKVTWKTPTAPAPTSPTLIYDIDNMKEGYVIAAGLDNTMEYRTRPNYEEKEIREWSDCPNGGIRFPLIDEDYILEVRYKTAANGKPSLAKEFLIQTREKTPIDYIAYYNLDEVLEIGNSDKPIEVAVGDGAEYVVQSPAFYTLEQIIDIIPTGYYLNFNIRYSATASEPASPAITIKLYGRNPNTPDSVYYSDGALYNLTPDMAFSFNGSGWYSTNYSAVDITAFMSTTSTTVLEIRYMPTDTMGCSKIRTIILPELT